jgi:hypothetical protein
LPPPVLETTADREGNPPEELDSLHAGLFNDPSEFYKDFAIQSYAADRPGATVSVVASGPRAQWPGPPIPRRAEAGQAPVPWPA